MNWGSAVVVSAGYQLELTSSIPLFASRFTNFVLGSSGA